MSKEAAVRAMREARYNQRAAAPAAKPARAAARATKAAEPVAPETPAAPPAVPVVEGLCGHRSMNGRSCTREHGHAAKSHRYS
ncbi:hypothetical protein [Nocardioides sp.]|uniref:hypothetical protein n=1 Tax=Nocardioides sp. TaxID=35761 RepID=UPI001A213BB5|nr:hypothetical protein [Nocardioides sp.]MBJ7358540.1 hypothetical protein [Nocardioides sp.]